MKNEKIKITYLEMITLSYVPSWVILLRSILCYCCCSVAKLCLALCDPKDCSSPGSSVLHRLLEFAQTHVHWVSDVNHLILCHPFLLPSIFPSIRVFSSESALCIRWPKCWSFSFNSCSSSSEWEAEINAITYCVLLAFTDFAFKIRKKRTTTNFKMWLCF